MKETVRIPIGYDGAIIAQWTNNLCAGNDSQVVFQIEANEAFYVAFRYLESEWMYRLVKFFRVGEGTAASSEISSCQESNFIKRLLEYHFRVIEN